MPVVLEGHRVGFDAIGTRWSLTTDRPIGPASLSRIHAVIDRYDRTWSRFRDDSAVASLSRPHDAVDLGPQAPALLGLLEELRVLTHGAVDPLVAASLAHLGYGPRVDLLARPGHLGAPAARVALSGTVAVVEPPALLDVGSAGKGQLADLVADELRADGHDRFTVDASGDLVTAGAPLVVALEHPFDPESAIGVVEVTDGAIAGSAVNRRAWTDDGGRRLHHVLDARTGRPVESIAATWVVADTAMLADALSTALFLVPPQALAERFAFRWVVMRTDGRVTAADSLPGELFR